jgi:Tfp pilus assembly protein PilX
MKTANASPRSRLAKASNGQTLLTVLVFVLITSLILAGIGSLVVSDYKASGLGVDYDRSLFAAEAGINYELNKISQNSANVDQKQSGSTPGTTYNTAAGTFSVYVTQRNGDGTEATPWSAGNNLWVYATGQSGSVKRTVKVAATGYGTALSGSYGAFGMTEGIINGTPTVVQGDVGTNGWLNFNGNPTVTGSVTFNGAGSNWQSKPNKSYTTVYNATAMAWPTVESIAVSAFGATGLSYVASHNDNLLASPPISNPVLLINSGTQTFVGKAGGANYYVTSLTCNGNSVVYFDNRNGPITIWAGPSESSSTFVFNGGSAAVKMSTDPSKPVRIYIALSNDVQLNGNVELDAGLYNVNASGSGRVIVNGNPTLYGSVIANKFTFNGNPEVVYTSGYFSINSQTYYGVVPPYSEVGGFY